MQVYVGLCHQAGQLACAVHENDKVIATLLELQRQQGAQLLHALRLTVAAARQYCVSALLRSKGNRGGTVHGW